MAKLLVTRLPTALDQVTPDVYNRLVRILEINLGQFDPNSTPQFNDENLSTLSFQQGDVVWNTSIGVLQVYTGNKWLQLNEPVNPQGFQMDASVGKVSVNNGGATTINVTTTIYGWDVEQHYT